jgi:hypothetical protein
MLWLETGSDDGVILDVGRRFDGHAAHYRLGFVKQGGAWKLSRVDYRDLHGQIPPEVVEYYDQHGWPPGLKQEGAGDTLR